MSNSFNQANSSFNKAPGMKGSGTTAVGMSDSVYNSSNQLTQSYRRSDLNAPSPKNANMGRRNSKDLNSLKSLSMLVGDEDAFKKAMTKTIDASKTNTSFNK
jgi:hypothetical protein